MRPLIALAALVAITACYMDTSTGVPLGSNPAGTYSLQSINGVPMPVSTVSNDTTTTIDTDVIALDSIGNWDELVHYHFVVGSAAAVSDSAEIGGFWYGSGNSLDFRTAQALVYIGTATDSTLSLSDASSLYVFKR